MIKPIIVVKMPCKLLYVIQVKGFLFNVLALLDIRVFGCLLPLLLLIGLTLFLQGLFLFSISLLFVSIHKQML